MQCRGDIDIAAILVKRRSLNRRALPSWKYPQVNGNLNVPLRFTYDYGWKKDEKIYIRFHWMKKCFVGGKMSCILHIIAYSECLLWFVMHDYTSILTTILCLLLFIIYIQVLVQFGEWKKIVFLSTLKGAFETTESLRKQHTSQRLEDIEGNKSRWKNTNCNWVKNTLLRTGKHVKGWRWKCTHWLDFPPPTGEMGRKFVYAMPFGHVQLPLHYTTQTPRLSFLSLQFAPDLSVCQDFSFLRSPG